jgi:lysophospholipase L1-like esterase
MKPVLQYLSAMTLVLSATSVLAQSPVWTGSWATAPMAAPTGEAKSGDEGITYRDFVHLSIGGKAVRVRLSNEYGTMPLKIDEVHIAKSAGEGAIVQASDQPVLFGGAHSVLIPEGTVAVSDPISLPVAAFADLAVSVYMTSQGDTLTYHQAAIAANYTAAGNQTALATLHNATKTPNSYLLTGIDVDAGPKASAVVVLGASVVNGTHSTEDKNLRWPDDLARRLQSNAPTANIGVLNEGIGGNRILHDNIGLGGLARVNRDVLSQSNATVLVFSMGTNDIGRSFFPQDKTESPITEEQLEWGTLQAVSRAHAHGMKVICATLNPYEGAAYYNTEGEKMRLAYNDFVRSNHDCDGMVDFDRATLDPAHPSRMQLKYDSGDHLHPNDAGYQTMANTFNLNLFAHSHEKPTF